MFKHPSVLTDCLCPAMFDLLSCPSGLQVQRQTHQSGLLSQSRGGAEEAQAGCRLTGGRVLLGFCLEKMETEWDITKCVTANIHFNQHPWKTTASQWKQTHLQTKHLRPGVVKWTQCEHVGMTLGKWQTIWTVESHFVSAPTQVRIYAEAFSGAE